MAEWDLNLSPSTAHDRLMRQTEPALGYDPSDPAGWREALRGKLSELIGYDRMPGDADLPPLNVRTLWRREHEAGTIEKLVFTCEPGAEATAYLCLPAGVQPPYPCFICLQGHSTGMHQSIAVAQDDETRPIEVEGDRDFGLGCMRRGIAALCIEQRGFGERREGVIETRGTKVTCHEAALHALMHGRTLIAERLFDVRRGIGVLRERGGFDLERLGVMGNSGGGTITMYAAALLPEVRFAMPSCVFCTYRDSLMKIHHCLDNYIPHVLRYAELADIVGLFAPRPIVVVAGRDDPIFPLSGVREAFEHLSTIYRDAGAESKCKLVVGEGGHRFYAESAWQEMQPLLAHETSPR